MKQWLLAIVLVLASQSLAISGELEIQQSILYPYKSSVILQDEFLSGNATSGAIGSLGWGTSNGTTTQIASETNRPGLLRRDTGAGAGTVTSLRFAGVTSSIFTSNLLHSATWIVRLNTNDANTTVRIGEANPALTTSPPDNGTYFEKLDADTNWFCITRNATVETRNDSSVAVDTNFNTFTIIRDTATSVVFQINNTVVCPTHTTNLTSGATTPWTHIVNSAAASKTMDIDYFQLRVIGLTR